MLSIFLLILSELKYSHRPWGFILAKYEQFLIYIRLLSVV